MYTPKRYRMQTVVYTVMDLKTGRRKQITETRPLREGLREPNLDGRYRVVTAKVI